MADTTSGSPQAVALELTRLILNGETTSAGDKKPYSRENVLDVFRACYKATHFTPMD